MRRDFFVTGTDTGVGKTLITAALLRALRESGLVVAGWVGNAIDPLFSRRDANVATLRQRLGAPCLGIVPWMARPDIGTAANALDGAARLSRIPLE